MYQLFVLVCVGLRLNIQSFENQDAPGMFIGQANILENVYSGTRSACRVLSGLAFFCIRSGIAGASTAGGHHLLII
jgi:hypothetical protein